MPDLGSYRRLLASHLGGGLRRGIATSGSTRNYLEDTTLKSSIPQGGQWCEWYLLRPSVANSSSDKVRQVDHVDVSTGFIYPDFPPGDQWAVAPYDGFGEPYELLSPWFHPLHDLHPYINEALKLCEVPSELVVAADATGYRQGLSARYPWLTNPSSIYRVGYLSAGEDRGFVDPYVTHQVYGHMEYQAGALYVAHPRLTLSLATSGTITGGFDSNATTFTGVSVANQPTVPFYAVLGREIVRVTATASGGTTWTVVRGQLGSAADSLDDPQTVTIGPLLFLQGLFPAYYLHEAQGENVGVTPYGLSLESDEAIPPEQWVVAGAIKEAWTSAPQVMEQIAEQRRIANLGQASLAFQRWQEQTTRSANLKRTFRELEVATF